jgi:hypothetical protein
MAELHARVDAAVLAALHDQADASGAPVDHLVERALAEFLGVEHPTLYQVSTAGALVEGVYQGAVSVGVVREHGDFGLGTFEDLDGEMVVLDGHVFRVGSDGGVGEVHDDARTPFAVVTRFGDPPAVTVDARGGFADLAAAIDRLRRSANVFVAVRVDGHFDAVHVRAACRTAPGVPLAVATEQQSEFELGPVRRHHGRLLVAAVRVRRRGGRLPPPLPDRRPPCRWSCARLPGRRAGGPPPGGVRRAPRAAPHDRVPRRRSHPRPDGRPRPGRAWSVT